MMSHYAVVQSRFEQIELGVLKQVLQQQAGMPLADAARIARKSRGILTELATYEVAEAVCFALRWHGYAVQMLPADKLPPARRPVKISSLQFDSEGFSYPTGFSGKTERIAWPCVFVISTGRISEIEEKRRNGTGGNNTDGEAMTTTQGERDIRAAYVVDILGVAEHGDFVSLRFPALGGNYSAVLGEDREGRRWFECFQELLRRLISHSKSSIVSPETRRLLIAQPDQKETQAREYQARTDERQFADYNRWLLLLASLKASQEET